MHHDFLFQVFLFAVYYYIGHSLFFGNEPKVAAVPATTETIKATATTTAREEEPKVVAVPTTTVKAVKAVKAPAAVKATAPTTITTPAVEPQQTIQSSFIPVGQSEWEQEVQEMETASTSLPTSAQPSAARLELVPTPIPPTESVGFGTASKTSKTNKTKATTTGRSRSRKTIQALSA